MAKHAAQDEEAVEADAPGVDPLVTTLKTKDYMGRLLQNATPGTTAAKDIFGRSVVTGDKDYMGRNLI